MSCKFPNALEQDVEIEAQRVNIGNTAEVKCPAFKPYLFKLIKLDDQMVKVVTHYFSP